MQPSSAAAFKGRSLAGSAAVSKASGYRRRGDTDAAHGPREDLDPVEGVGFRLWAGGVPKGFQVAHGSEVFCSLQGMWSQAG